MKGKTHTKPLTLYENTHSKPAEELSEEKITHYE